MNLYFKIESTKLLLLLFLTDFTFILLHCFHLKHFLSNILFSIEKDFGYAEIYQYIKEYWIIVLLFMLAIKRDYIIYFAWTLLFIYLLCDDSLRIHEKFGHYLADYFEFKPMFQLRAQDFGELAVSIFFGFLLFTFIGISYLFSDNIAKQISKHLFILIMFLAFFGIVIDMLQIAISWGTAIWGLIEEGGEMLTMSVITWYVFNLEIEQKNA